MRAILALCCAAAMAAVIQLPCAAQTTGTLTGKMAPFNYVFGAPWKCTSKVPPMGNQPARTETSTVTFEVVPNNVMHVHIAGDQYTADQYFGYSTMTNSYWSSTADGMGMTAAEQSSDGKSYKGSAGMGSMSGTAMDTYTKNSDNNVTIHSTMSMGGRTGGSDTTCTR